jgi:murein DD-endopeptidase MepM/ murein hydrolase activator NlpD
MRLESAGSSIFELRVIGGRTALFQRSDRGYGAAAGTAALSMNQAIKLPVNASPLQQRLHAYSERLASVDWTPDLGTNIASFEWLRGLATCVALCASTAMLAPGIRPLHGATDRPLEGRAWDETRAQTIAPLAWGADSGKRMAATDLVAPLTDSPERPTIELTATLGQGDGFARVLERAGVSPGEASHVANMVAGVADLGGIEPGTVIPIVLGARPQPNMPRPLQSLQLRAAFDLKVAIARGPGGLQITRIPISVDRAPLRIRGRVGDSLYYSARAAGVPAKAIETYLRAIGDKISFDRDMYGNAVFDIVVDNARAATGEARAGKLLYAGFETNGRRLSLLEWTVNGHTQWFDAGSIGQRRSSGMVAPVTASRISSGFGMRFHPVLGYSRFHKGIDFAAVTGTPIHAVTDGYVALAGRAGGYGNQVRLTHNGSIMTTYSHMSRIAVSPGQSVVAGQIIGYVGTTGLSTGPHLHFEIIKNGVAINPAGFAIQTPSLINGPELEAFKARLRGLLETPVTGA